MTATPAEAADGSACPRCGARFRCGIEAGDRRCWCARLPPLSPLPATAQSASLAASCLCPACLRALLASAEVLRPATP